MFELSVLTPQGATLENLQVDEVTAPGVQGEFGVLPGHIPFISATRAGVLSYRKGGERGRVAVGPGYVEVDMKGGVAVLVRKAILADKVDAGAAEQQQRDLEGRLTAAGLPPGERTLLEEDLAWARAQQEAKRS